jgi:4-nitrophenyl phosphatase
VQLDLTYKGYLIDLDGTMYRGEESIEGAKEFIGHLYEQDLPYLFITNNSSASRAEVAEKLTRMGMKATEKQIVTSAVATANYIKRKQVGASVFVIGERGLRDALTDNGCIITDVQADFVVIGIDRDITYEKLATAGLLIRRGATFISTNKDAAIPTERGLLPGNGALTAVLTYSTGTQPLYIGKPEKWIMEEALELIGLKRKDVVMVGDNYQTDILAGIHANIDTLMVLTGFSSHEDLQKVDVQPTHVIEHLTDWIK